MQGFVKFIFCVNTLFYCRYFRKFSFILTELPGNALVGGRSLHSPGAVRPPPSWFLFFTTDNKQERSLYSEISFTF